MGHGRRAVGHGGGAKCGGPWALGEAMGEGRRAMGSGPWVRGGGPWARGCDRGGGDSSKEEMIANLQRMRAAPGGKT